jgi:hypothetical protein
MSEIIAQNNLEFETPLEDEYEDSISSDSKQIFTDQSDPEIDSLIRRIKKGTLVLQPDFQRYYVWDDVKASRLIESALLEIPLPTIYLSEEKDGRVYVIDGQQRLTAFVSFIDGKFPDNKVFKLRGLKVFTDLNGKTFADLAQIDTNLQDKITGFSVRTITFKKESGKDLKFEIFERLNTGSVSLNDQELRNCIYRGTYNKLLKTLSLDTDFQFLLNISKPDNRMGDIELVLRFAAFHHSTYLNYKPPMKKFLSSEMEKYQNISDKDKIELEIAFKNAVMIIKSLLDKNAFKRFYKGKEGNHDGYWEPKRFNASLYDVLMYTFARQDKNTVYQHLDSIREAFIDLMCNDQEFIDSIELSTSSIQAVTKRFDKFRLTLQDIIGINTKEPRLFSYQLKKSLFDSNPTCSICQQRISNIDDSAVDHIEMYWKGGKTIPENARLTHKYCNWARSKKDTTLPAK